MKGEKKETLHDGISSFEGFAILNYPQKREENVVNIKMDFELLLTVNTNLNKLWVVFILVFPIFPTTSPGSAKESEL